MRSWEVVALCGSAVVAAASCGSSPSPLIGAGSGGSTSSSSASTVSSSTGGGHGCAASSSASTGGAPSAATGTGGMGGTSSSASSSSSTGGGTTCAPAWSRGFPGSGIDAYQAQVNEVAVDPAGNIVVSGSFSGLVDLGTGPLTAQGLQQSIFVAKYDCAGNALWGKAFGDPFSQSDAVFALATDALGDVVLTGQYFDPIDFGCGALPASGLGLGFITKLDGDGTCLWSKSYGGMAGNDYGMGIGVDASGHVLVTGLYDGMTDFGGGPVDSKGWEELFLLALDQDGSFLWVKQFGTPAGNVALTLDASSNVILCGAIGSQASLLDFGGGLLPAGPPLFLAKLDASGNLVWAEGVGEPGHGYSTECLSVAADPSGNIVFGGAYLDPPNFGPGPLPTPALQKNDAFIAKYTSGGKLVFALGDAGMGFSTVQGVATNAAGDVLATGTFGDALTLAGPPLTYVGVSGGSNGFLLQLTPSGAFVSSRSFGDAQTTATPLGIAVTPMVGTVIAGAYSGAIDFGNGPLPASSDGESPFVTRL